MKKLDQAESLDNRPALAAILLHQETCATLINRINELESTISEQEFVMENAMSEIPSFPDRKLEREDLLAAISMGTANDAQLVTFDNQIEKERAEVNNAKSLHEPIIIKTRQTVAGLVRALEALKVELDTAELRTKSVVNEMLLEEAEIACTDYVNLALRVKERFLQLVALDRLLKRHDGMPRDLLTFDWVNKMQLPIVNLPQCAGLQNPNWPGILFSAYIEGYKDTFQRAEEEEKVKLKALGVEVI